MHVSPRRSYITPADKLYSMVSAMTNARQEEED